MKTWQYEAALGRAKRLRRFKRPWVGLRQIWYELGFWDGWEARETIGTIGDMAHKKAEIAGGKGAPGPKSGSPDKAPHHEGPAGDCTVAKSKFGKESRDPVEQKEPGKSRGPGG